VFADKANRARVGEDIEKIACLDNAAETFDLINKLGLWKTIMLGSHNSHVIKPTADIDGMFNSSVDIALSISSLFKSFDVKFGEQFKFCDIILLDANQSNE